MVRRPLPPASPGGRAAVWPSPCPLSSLLARCRPPRPRGRGSGEPGAARSHGEKRQNRFLERVSSAGSTLRPPSPALSLPLSPESPRPSRGHTVTPWSWAVGSVRGGCSRHGARRRRRSRRLRPPCPSHPLPPAMAVRAGQGECVSVREFQRPRRRGPISWRFTIPGGPLCTPRTAVLGPPPPTRAACSPRAGRGRPGSLRVRCSALRLGSCCG